MLQVLVFGTGAYLLLIEHPGQIRCPEVKFDHVSLSLIRMGSVMHGRIVALDLPLDMLDFGGHVVELFLEGLGSLLQGGSVSAGTRAGSRVFALLAFVLRVSGGSGEGGGYMDAAVSLFLNLMCDSSCPFVGKLPGKSSLPIPSALYWVRYRSFCRVLLWGCLDSLYMSN